LILIMFAMLGSSEWRFRILIGAAVWRAPPYSCRCGCRREIPSAIDLALHVAAGALQGIGNGLIVDSAA
jgi:hypothetical protein